MELNDFSSLIEVGIALCLAVAALDNEKNYVLTIYNALFSIVDYIKDQFASIKLCDEQTFKSYKDGLSEENKKKVDFYDRDRQSLINDISEIKKKLLEEDVTKLCACPQIRKSNLWTALYGLVCLFISGLKDAWGTKEYFWFAMALLSLLSLGLIWTIAKDCFKIQGTVICFIVCIIISVVFSYNASIENWQWLKRFESIYIPLSVLLIYVNILGIVLTACHRIPPLKKKTNELVNTYKKKSEVFNSQMTGVVKQLKGEHFFDIGDDIKIDKTDTN